MLRRVEFACAALLLAAVVILVGVASVARAIGSPIIWSVEIAQLLFLWLCVFSIDLALQDQRCEVGPGGVDGRRQTGGARSDDDDVAGGGHVCSVRIRGTCRDNVTGSGDLPGCRGGRWWRPPLASLVSRWRVRACWPS